MNLLRNVYRWVVAREPVVVVNTVAAAATAWVANAQGDLHGEHAWLAVAWAVAVAVQRQLVTPARKDEV